MAYFSRLDKLAVAANSMGLFEGMLMYCDRENARDLEFANVLDNLWVELLERTNERQLFITGGFVSISQEELAVAGNSNNLTDAVSVYIQKEINADLQFAVGLSQQWDVLYNRVNEIKILSSELNLFGGPLAVQCAKYLKQLSKSEVLTMLKLRKTIAKDTHLLHERTQIHLFFFPDQYKEEKDAINYRLPLGSNTGDHRLWEIEDQRRITSIRYLRLSSSRIFQINYLLAIYGDAYILNRRSKVGSMNQGVEEEKKPALVLDDSCTLQSDILLSIFGKMKEFGSLSKLKVILAT
nr:nucleotide-binding alpha-beta plait domain-containing protein [Tanacetum cinerariifolium]